MTNHKAHIEATLSSLKDFQKATVDYVVKKMSEGQNKFLIADEVGLGKTIVAKGIIARLYDQQCTPNKDFRIIYICSNQALAKQNLDKLNFIKDNADNIIEYNGEDDRLISLAYEPKDLKNEYRLKIKALTPATSFDNRRRAGKSDERVLLFRLLMHIPGMEYRLISLKWFLRGGNQISEKNWNSKIEEAVWFEKEKPAESYVRKIRKEVYKKFKTALKNRLSDSNQKIIFGDIKENRTILKGLFHILEERKQNRSFENGRDEVFKKYYGLIAELRLQLSYVCKDYLKADIFILDEFQRFSQLIKQGETENKGEEIARVIFSDSEAKVLLLSATPFKPYTNAYDEYNGENHYKEFKTVLQFLHQNKPTNFWEELDEKNRLFFDGIKNYGSKKEADNIQIISLKESIEKVYREGMARTERNIVEQNQEHTTNDSIKYLNIQPDDINDFIAVDEIILENNRINDNKLSHPVEYVKSSPFPLSFLQDYDHHKVLKRNYGENRHLQKLIKQSKKAFVPIERIETYKPLLPEKSINEPNPKLRLLYDETIRKNGFRLLWIPPSLKYYQTKGGPYSNADSFSKTLIFSAWKMVPRMVSALVSYEAERLSIGKLYEQEEVSQKYRYLDKKRYPSPLLTFKKTDSGLSGMNNLMLAYPSVYLASLYNPVENIIANKDLSRIKLEIKNKIASRLKSLGILSLGNKSSGGIQKWDWLAVLLLDRNSEKAEDIKRWLKESKTDNLFDNENETDNKASDTHKSAKQIHFQEIRNYILEGELPEIGRLNSKQLDRIADHLASMCLGAPGINALRAIGSIYQSASISDKLTSAINIGLGMISMFNKPESIAIVKVAKDENFYYQNVLSYAIDGNIQAMLDEFIYQLSDSGGISDCLKAAEIIKNILMVGGSKVDVMTESSIKDDKHFSMRTHYAVPFGSSESSDLKNGRRQIKVREAFNSPFRPFVLTSTSIGQEGLDFHYYCQKIIHWNLPGNPIDLEQREGRIKRYKSLLVRKNVASLYHNSIKQNDIKNNIWDVLFSYASQGKKQCDLIPFWHINTKNNKIESLVPLYRYSKDVSKYNHIKSVLTNYRLTFGQPNQDDLISNISTLSREEQEDLKKLLINLCPLEF